MLRRGLMARLAAPDSTSSIPVLESVNAHLQDLFNASANSSQSAQLAGLPCIADITRSEGATEALQACIKATLAELEPRLAVRSVVAQQLDEELKIHIEIQGNLLDRGGQPVLLVTELHQCGKLEMT